MLFNSLAFLFLFLPVTYFVFWRLQSKTARYIWLTAASYVFYGAWNYKFTALMAFSTLVAYTSGVGLLSSRSAGRRKVLLIIPIIVDLSLLSYFKYSNFFFDTVDEVAMIA